MRVLSIEPFPEPFPADIESFPARVKVRRRFTVKDGHFGRPRGFILDGRRARRHTESQDCYSTLVPTMRDTQLLQLALNINWPWFVAASDFDAQNKRLDIEIDFKAGARFACPECKAADCPVHDTAKKTWRHLDFFQHQAFLHARMPRIACEIFQRSQHVVNGRCGLIPLIRRPTRWAKAFYVKDLIDAVQR